VSLTICKHIAKAAQANPQTKALSKSLQSQSIRKKKFKKCPPPQDKNTMKITVTNRPTNHDRQGSTGGNRRLAQWRVRWLIEHSTSHQILWCIESFVLRNPPLRQAPKR
jgi:hypothetical protein